MLYSYIIQGLERGDLLRILKIAYDFLLKKTDIIYFIGIMMLKLYLFATFVDLLFLRKNLLIVSLGSLMLIASLTLLLTRKKRYIALVILNAVLSSILFSDLIYFRYFEDFITVPVLIQVRQVASLGGSILDLIEFKDIMFFIDIIALLIFYRHFKKIELKKNSWKKRVMLFVLITSFAVLAVVKPINEYVEKYGSNLFINGWSNVSIYNQTGQIGFHIYDIKRYLNQYVLKRNELTQEEKNFLKKELKERKKNLEAKSKHFGIAEDKNVIIIQLESFENYAIGKTVNGEEITPNLNKLKEESFYFNNFHHQTAQGRTSDAEFVINNSLYPLSVGSVYVRYPMNEYMALPNILKEKNYYTAAFHPYEKSFWNRNIIYNNFEFDDFFGKGDFVEKELIGPFGSQGAVGDKVLFEQMVDISKDKGKFFSFVIALTSHHPYSNIPNEYRKLDMGKYENDIFGNYLHSLHYVDNAIGELIYKLKKERLWDETVLVIYGDHDSGIEMDKEKARFVGVSENDLNIKLTQKEVPLFIHLPNQKEGKQYNNTVSMIDIAPTVIELLGIEQRTNRHLGRSVFDLNNHFVVFRYGSFTDGKVYFDSSRDGNFLNGVCYDYKKQIEIENKHCQKGYKKVLRELELSDNIIFNDLLKETKE